VTKPTIAALAKARAALESQLEALELSEVVLVDDESLKVPQVRANKLPILSEETYLATLEDPEADLDPEAFSRWKSEQYQELVESDPDVIARERRERIYEKPSEVDSSIEVLGYMCGPQYRPMTPQAWGNLDTPERETIAENSLVLFDRELGEGVDPGDQLLGEFLREFPNAYAAILTNKVNLGDEIIEALAASERQQAAGAPTDPARSLIASKQRLMSSAPIDFVEDLRITRAAPLLVSARNQLLKLAESAHTAAIEELRERIELRTLEHIVVRAARSEGSWEADALLRVLAIAYRSEAQSLLLGDATLAKLADVFAQIRTIFARSGGPDESARLKTAELMQRERYDPGPLINVAGLPLACGDLFQTGRGADESDKRLWMLLDQPCDLQLRDTKNSRGHISSTDLIEVASAKKPKKGRIHLLPSGSRYCPDGEQLYLMLSSRMTVPFDVLELCVFDKDGECRIDTEAAEPANVPQTPALTRRWSEMTEVHRETVRVALVTEDDDLRKRMIGHDGVLAGDTQQGIAWPIRRVERLNEPHAQPALRAVSDDRSRPAFDADLNSP
jgi:hypothetical protein